MKENQKMFGAQTILFMFVVNVDRLAYSIDETRKLDSVDTLVHYFNIQRFHRFISLFVGITDANERITGIEYCSMN